MSGIDGFEQQAFELIMGSAQDAFDINKVPAKERKLYGKGLGENLLRARRLCEAGCGFVTVTTRFVWDNSPARVGSICDDHWCSAW